MSDKNKKNSPVLKGAAWVSSSRLLVRFLGLISTVILARLLAPEDFGLVAVASSIIGILEACSALNFDQALVRFQKIDDDDYSTAWTLNMLRGLFLCVILLLLSYPLSIILNDSRLFLILAIISVYPLFGGLDNPRIILYEKELRFDVLFQVMVLTKLAGVLLTVTVAYLLRSYWALISGMILKEMFRSALTYCYARGKLRLTLKKWRKLFSFTGWLTGTEMLNAFSNRVDPLILASYQSPYVVGILHMARELSNMTFGEVTTPLRRVVFPSLSQCTESPSEFLFGYKQAVSGLFLVLSPICVGFVLTTSDLIPLILGGQWNEVVFPVQLIMIALLFSIIGQFAHSAAMAKGETKLIFYQSLLVTPIKLLVVFIGIKWFGLYGAIYAICFELILSTFIRMYICKKVTTLGFFQQLFIIRNNLIPLVVMASMVYLTSQYVTIVQEGTLFHLTRLIAMVLIGIITYSGSCLVIWKIRNMPPGPETTLINFLLNMFSKRLRNE